MTYSIIETISIIFIVLGVLLAISAVVTFYTKNMAEVYDALLNRGYTERIEKRKRIKQAKRKKASAVNVINQTAMPQTVASSQSPPKSAPVRASRDVGASANVQNNSGNTVLLNNNNSGQTTLLDSQTSGETTVLDNSIQSEFKIIKHLEYTFAKEVIS